MTFVSEAEFEKVLIGVLREKGWGEYPVIKNLTEEQLLQNWADILFSNNKGIDRLNNVPLTHSEMQQIIEQINTLKTPLKLNSFINGKTVSIVRDNPEDNLHLGKEISLKIYDRLEIAAGQSRYQIVQQPIFKTKSKILNDRRGDLMLLINGMPVIHIELKKSKVPVSQAYNQIEKYSREGVFTGLFSLIQVFVAMEPEESVYFANPGMDGKWNKDYYFHWADFNNEPINNWKDVASTLLSIPMAHQLIGFYTVADDADGVLKVMRSYQYYAANAISDKVGKIKDWKSKNTLGGYIWHTTGSGKTMTSFKSAQLIANSKDADKVIFLMDRIELGTQSLNEYRAFADENEDIQATENTGVLVTKLKSSDPANTLIVTSIQKMSRIDSEEEGLKAKDIELMSNKRVVFIVDEAHRSTFGDMLITIKKTFPYATFFGFTGTPIHDENKKKDSTTATVFGNELHRYSIADGIRDKNVLGFDPYKVLTYRDKDLREAVALQQAKAKDIKDALSDENKKKVFNKFMHEVKMAGYLDEVGKYKKGIEDFIPTAQYERDVHRNKVVEDIVDGWVALSQNSKFHAIFATSSIPEAIIYYRLLKVKIKEVGLDLKITALFDSNIDNDDGATSAFKEDGLVEILEDYNRRYGQDFSLKIFPKFKKDIASRLAHKKPYITIEKSKELQIDLLIVVDQMLTGFDSKWINTLYLDKLLEYANIIQAFSRTNRLFGMDKPFGTIRYYRKPHTMDSNIHKAIKSYSGDKPLGLFVDRLENNLKKLNSVFDEIFELYKNAGIENFEKLPDDLSERGEFAKLFKEFSDHLEAAKIQSFTWDVLEYRFEDRVIKLNFDEIIYHVLVQRYKELSRPSEGSGGSIEVPFEIDGYITEIDTEMIDTEFMNSRFNKYLKILTSGNPNEIEKTLNELHKSFASLSQEEQKYANIFIHDIQSGNIQIDENRSFKEYIAQYQANAEDEKIAKLVELFGLDGVKLKEMLSSPINDANINDYGRFDDLKNSVDKEKATVYFEAFEGSKIAPFKVNMKVHNLLKDFILNGEYAL